MAKTKLVNNYTEGSIPKHLVRFMLPFMASNALQVVYSLVDMIVVGQYVGSAGLAGVSQGSMVVLFFSMFCLGFSSSGQIMISQLVGADRRDELNPVIGTLFSVTLLGGVILSVLSVVLRFGVINLLKVPPEARDMAISYILICGGGLIFTCGYNTVSAALRGMGDSRHPFIFITITSVLNLVLDLLLTGYFGLGVVGAAIATVFSQAVSFIIALIFLQKRKDQFYFDFKPASFRIRKDIFGRMVKLGVPLALQTCTVNISMMICNSFINSVGVAAAATFGVGLKIDDIANKLTLGIQYAAAPMVGQNFGAGKNRRVRTVVYWTWFIGAVIYGLFTLCYLLFGKQIFALFTTDTAVIALAPVFIVNIIWSFPGMTIMRGTSSFFQGTSNAVMLMIFAFVDSGLRVLLCWLMGIALEMGFYGFVLGFAFAVYGIAVPGILYFFFAPWTKRGSMISSAKPET